MDLNAWLPIEDFSNETLLAVAERLEQSHTPRHWIVREAELDDLWRHVEAAMDTAARAGAPSRAIEGLRRLFDAVAEAHDLTGDGHPHDGAKRLRRALVPEPSESQA